MASLLSFRDRFHRGLFTNVFLHARLEKRYADRPQEVKAQVKRAGLKKEIVMANVRKMRKLVVAARVGPAEGRVDGVRGAQHLHRRRRRPQGRVRPLGRHIASLGPGLGHRRQQRPLLAHRRRGRLPR